jgi:hypothetical protein
LARNSDTRAFRAACRPVVALCKDGSGECVLAAARLKNAPYENLLLEYRKVKDEWLLVKTWSLVDH